LPAAVSSSYLEIAFLEGHPCARASYVYVHASDKTDCHLDWMKNCLILSLSISSTGILLPCLGRAPNQIDDVSIGGGYRVLQKKELNAP
jgi:hypothetical protein